MKMAFCAKTMKFLETFYPNHQIFKTLDEERNEKRISELKQVMAIADLFGFKEFYAVLDAYVKDCIEEPFFNILEALIFESEVEKIRMKFKTVFELFERMKLDGISEFPISSDYSIESWIVKWSKCNSYYYVKDLLRWFFVDFEELAVLQSKMGTTYETAYHIIENISNIKNFDNVYDFLQNVKFVVDKEKIYSALELFFDIIIGVGNISLIPVFKKYLKAISIADINELFKPFWKRLELNESQEMYIGNSNEFYLNCKQVVEYGINPETKTIFYNDLVEIVEFVDSNEELNMLPKKIMEKISA